MKRNLITPASLILKVTVATLCLFGFPVFAKWIWATSDLERLKSVAVYSVGVIALFVIAVTFRSMNKDTARLLNQELEKTS